KTTIPPLTHQHLTSRKQRNFCTNQHPKPQPSISHIAPIISATPAVAILNPVNRTKIPITNPHDNPFENLATICKPIAVKMMFQIPKISIDVNNTPNAPSASTIEFKLVKYTSGLGLSTAKNANALTTIPKIEIISINVFIE